MRKPLKILLLVLLVLVLVVGGYVIYVFASYDRIEDNQVLDVNRPEQTAAGASTKSSSGSMKSCLPPLHWRFPVSAASSAGWHRSPSLG